MSTAHGYVWAKGRRVHFRAAGQGPPVVLLHASPVSGASLADRVEAFATQGAQAFALDTPGYGESDELPLDAPALADYAQAHAETLDALGLERVVIYGRHTGAAIGAQFAALFPDRVALLYCDGYPVYDEDTRARYLQRYVKAFPHDFTGSHLVWAWNRYREQFIHWPWFEQNANHRADTDMPSPSWLHRGTIDLLAAGAGYGRAEAAVFGRDTGALLASVRAPLIVAAREGDSLRKRVSELHRHGVFDVRDIPRSHEAAVAAEWHAIAPYLGGTRRRFNRAGSVPANRVDRRIVTGAGADWCIRTRQSANGAGEQMGALPLILVPDGPLSAQVQEAWMIRQATRRVVWAADWPGSGNSMTDAIPPTQTEAAACLLALLELENIERFDVQGWGVGAWIASEIAKLAPERIRCVGAVNPTAWPATSPPVHAWLPDLTPTADGAHLVRAWQYVRDLRLWSPWSARRREHVIAGHPPSIDALDLDLLALSQQPDHVSDFESWYTECHNRGLPVRRHPEPTHLD